MAKAIEICWKHMPKEEKKNSEAKTYVDTK